MRLADAVLVTCACASICVGTGCGGTPAAGTSSPGTGAAGSVEKGKARVVEVSEPGQLLAGPFARGRVGDFRLENEHVAFIVDAPDRAQSYAASGGNVVDAGPSRPGAEDRLGQVTLYLDDDLTRSAVYETAEPGRDPDGAATLTVTGTDLRNPYLRVVTTYRLAGASRFLEMESRFENLHELEDIIDFEVGDAIAWHGSEPYIAGLGTGHEGDFEGPWVAGVAEGITYAYTSPEGGLWGRSGGLVTHANVTLLALKRESSQSVKRYLAVVEGEDLPEAARIAASLNGMEPSGVLAAETKPLGAIEVLVEGTARAVVRGVEGTPDPVLGGACDPGARGNVMIVEGQASRPIPAGLYEIVVARGPEYSIHIERVEVLAAQTARVQADLARVMDTKGALAADLRQHTRGSLDSCLDVEDRYAADLAEGLEVVALTDVNSITAPGPGGAGLVVIAGEEIATDLSGQPVGRFSVWPLAPDAGALAWSNVGLDDIVGAASAAKALVQIDHPRDPDVGYLALVGFVRDASPSSIESILGLGFQCFEVWSGKDVKSREVALRDWIRLLGIGYSPTATGGSGSTSFVGDEPGYPRTYVLVDGNSPAEVSVTDVMEALEAHAAVVSSGPFLTIAVGKTTVGGLAKKAGKTVKLSVHLEAAPWTKVDQIEILVGGDRFGDPIAVPPPPGGPTSGAAQIFDTTFTVKLVRDDVVMAVARGTVTYEPVLPARPAVTPWAVTNPIWIDADRSGAFDPPATE